MMVEELRVEREHFRYPDCSLAVAIGMGGLPPSTDGVDNGVGNAPSARRSERVPSELDQFDPFGFFPQNHARNFVKKSLLLYAA